MIESIVVGTDGSPTAEQAVERAAKLGKALGARQVELYARKGDPAEAILDVVQEVGADLVIVGSKGMRGTKRFLLGSVPNKVSHHAPCDVMIVRTGL